MPRRDLVRVLLAPNMPARSRARSVWVRVVEVRRRVVVISETRRDARRIGCGTQGMASARTLP